MNIGLRIKELRRANNIGSGAFADMVGIDRSQFSKIENDKLTPTISQLMEISSIFGNSIDWLLTGNGNMLKTKEADIDSSKRKLIPFYDMDMEGGTIQISNMDGSSQPAEYIDAGDWFLDADSAMRVHGDSMYPEYKSGSIVVMREVFDKRLIVYGEDYMIQTHEYRVIKRLYKGGMDGYWMACSINEETWEKGPMAGRLIYEPFEIFIDDAIKLCRVIGCVKRTESSRIVYNQNKKI